MSAVGGPEIACTSIVVLPRSSDRRSAARSAGVSPRWHDHTVNPCLQDASGKPPINRGHVRPAAPERTAHGRGVLQPDGRGQRPIQRTDQAAKSHRSGQRRGQHDRTPARGEGGGGRRAHGVGDQVAQAGVAARHHGGLQQLHCEGHHRGAGTTDRQRQPARRSPTPSGAKRKRLRRTSTPPLFPHTRQSRGVEAEAAAPSGWAGRVRIAMATRPRALSHRPTARSWRVTAAVRVCSPRPPSGGSAGRRPGRSR